MMKDKTATTIKLQYVDASEIWPTAENHFDHGSKPCLLRGYNLEVKTKDGKTDWMAAEWIFGEPSERFFDESHKDYRNEFGLEPTGRICFRGYGYEEYDVEERETYIQLIDDEAAAEM